MARYFLRFRHSDTGLSPQFSNGNTFFKKASDLSPVTPPPIGEVGNGTYYFDYSPTFDIVFEVDGGSSIPTEEVRYISDTISPKDIYIDEPTSQVRTDVWGDSTAYVAGQKGKRVDDIGAAADPSATATLFGKALLYTERIRGDSAGLTDGNSGKQIYDRIGLPVTTNISGDIAAVQLTGNNIYSRIGAPAGASVSADIAAVKSDTSSINSTVSTNLDVAVSTRAPAATAVSNADYTAIRAAKLDNLDVAVSTRLSSAGYTAPDNTSILAIKAKTDNLPASPASTGDVTAAQAAIQGSPSIDLRTMSGTLFAGATDSLHALGTAASGSLTSSQVAAAVLDALLSAHTTAGTVGERLNNVAVVTDVTSARDNIKGSSLVDLTQIAGTGFSSATHSLKATSDGLMRALGMLHENSVLDQATFDTNNNMLSARIRIYNSAANAQAAQAVIPATYNTGKIGEYAVVATYAPLTSNLDTYVVTKVP